MQNYLRFFPHIVKYAHKIGKPTAEKFVSIIDDGTNPNIRGPINVNGE